MKRLNHLLIILISFTVIVSSCSKEKKSEKVNVLFIAVDDLRLQAGIYGKPQMKTPSIDRLGNEGMVFTKAYCSVPVCGASRASLLSGLYPTANRFLNFSSRKDNDAPEVVSLPMHFKNNGYTTLSRGKIYHHGDDDIEAWSEKPFFPNTGQIGGQSYLTDESKAIIEKNRDSIPDKIIGPAFEAADVADNEYPDGKLTDKVLEDLKRFSSSKEPFFLAVGFWKPHLPFNAPKKYWDLYDENDIKLADNPYSPKNAPEQAMSKWLELRNMYDGIPKKGPIPDDLARNLVHGYYSCVSYTDAQIGKILDELDRLGLAENTIVVLWGDHGWHLGEHGLWCKHCNFNKVINAPLIVRVPGLEKNDKNRSNSFVEFIDIYPTLCDLTDTEIPHHIDGKSFVEVLKDPEVSIHESAYVRFHDGETVVNQRFGYTEWTKNGEIEASMLYDHEKDPNENISVANDPEYKGIVSKMQALLNEKREYIIRQK